jgi:hypothetical protein
MPRFVRRDTSARRSNFGLDFSSITSMHPRFPKPIPFDVDRDGALLRAPDAI